MMEKQVCFDSKPTIIDDKNPVMNPEQSEEGNEKSSNHDLIDGMWEKLVLYYLSRLKGLCDWTNNEKNIYDRMSAHSNRSDKSLDALSERKLIERITKQTIKDSMDIDDNIRMPKGVSAYMAAGYKEGKQQAARIIVRALKYGVLTGILKKEDSIYRFHHKFFNKNKTPKSTRCKILYKRKCKIRNHKMKLRTRKTRRSKNQSEYSNSISEACSSDKSLSPSVHHKPKPEAKRKNSRVAIERPVKRRPQRRKRDRSQTKSPTPTRSPSKTSVHEYRTRKLSSFKKYRTPFPKRDGSVISDVSSDNISVCTLCKIKRKRSRSNNTEKTNVKRSKS